MAGRGGAGQNRRGSGWVLSEASGGRGFGPARQSGGRGETYIIGISCGSGTFWSIREVTALLKIVFLSLSEEQLAPWL